MKVSDVWGNLVPNTWTADREGALPALGPRPHNKSCVSSGGTELATSGFCGVELHHVTEICRPALMMNGVHQGSDFELNSCLHRQPVKTLYSAGLTGVR